MSADDLIVGCGTLSCLITIGVALFFAMYFGNLFSIPGVIVLLIIGVVVIVGLAQMLSEARQEAIKQRANNKHLEKQIEEHEQKDREREERERKKRQEQEGWQCLVM